MHQLERHYAQLCPKVLSGVLVRRISAGGDSILREEQEGFRKGRVTTEHIHTLHNIIEEVIE